MAPQFFETLMGKRFYEGTMPMLAKAAQKLAEGLALHGDKSEAITTTLNQQNELLAQQNKLMERQNELLVGIGRALEGRS